MTCQDCKYYKPINDNEGKCKSPMDAYYGFDTTVVGNLGKCDYFKPTHESVGNALEMRWMRWTLGKALASDIKLRLRKLYGVCTTRSYFQLSK